MAKKDFKNNPALQFITVPEEETAPEPEQIKVEPAKSEEGRTRTKKSNAPTRTVIINGEAVQVETKSKRLHLLTTPSLYEKIKKNAKREKVSINEYINIALAEYTKEK